MTEEASSFYTSFGDFAREVLAAVRRQTYGEDIGQFGWITADELRRFIVVLGLDARSHVLDVACGTGGPTLCLAETTGGQVTGIDINDGGIASGTQLARDRGLHDRVRFRTVDASGPLPFDAATFDAIVCIDAINHLFDRLEVMKEWYRVLRPGGRFLFTDGVIVTGMLRREEILARSSSMGQFIFTPPGVHDRFIEAAGFVELVVEDVTATIAAVTRRWHAARLERRADLLKIETQAAFDALQGMLAAAHTMSSERRLSRFAYSARKPE